ncbi:hypothetical protein, partial [Brevundimonas vesicularis]
MLPCEAGEGDREAVEGAKARAASTLFTPSPFP